MASKNQNRRTKVQFIVCLSLTLLLSASEISARKLKKEELIKLHLESLGDNPLRESRIAQGRGSLDIRVGGTGQLAGPALWVSEGTKVRSSFRFGHVQYGEELLVYDGDKLDVGHISPGMRSQLGQSLWAHFGDLVSEGLYGGVLSTEWSLLRVDERRPKIKYKGLKKFEDKKLHLLEYIPREDVDYKIALYFEPETYHHVLSSYRLTIPSGRIRPIESFGRGSGAIAPRSPGDGLREDFAEATDRVTVIERFKDFKQVDGLNLPHIYRVTINFDQFRGSFVGHWQMEFDQITHDRKIDPNVFAIE